MKIRQGFVSNSSSSSFIIATKGELTDRSKLEKKLLELFGVSSDSWLYDFAKDCAELLARRGTKCETLQDLANDIGCNIDEVKEYRKFESDLIEEGWSVFCGSVYSDSFDRQAEIYLVDFEIDHYSDTLIFQKGAGF